MSGLDSQLAMSYRGYTDVSNLTCEEIAACTAERYVWGILGPLILLTGCTGNLIIIFIFFNPEQLRKKPVLSLTLGLLAIFDLLALVTGLLRHWLRKSFYVEIDIQTVAASNFVCKFHEFVIYFSLTMATWTLVLISFERFTIVWFRMKVNRFLTVRITLTVFAILAVLATGLHVHFFWSRGLVNNNQNCDNLRQYHFFTEEIMPTLDVIFSTILPMVSVFILNTCILIKLYTHMRERARLVAQGYSPRVMGPTTRMLLIVMLLFILLVLPAKVYIALMPCKAPLGVCVRTTSEQRRTYEAYRLAWTFILLLQYSNHSINFYIYLATSGAFRKDLKRIVCRQMQRGSRVSDDILNRPEYIAE